MSHDPKPAGSMPWLDDAIDAGSSRGGDSTGVVVMTQGLSIGFLGLVGWVLIGFVDRGEETRDKKDIGQHREIPVDAMIGSLAFAPDGRGLAVATRDGRVMTWDLKRSRPVRSTSWDWTPRVAFSPDGRTLAATGSNASVGLWDPGSGEMVDRIDIEGGQLHRLAFAPDGRTLALGGRDGGLVLWDLADGSIRAQAELGRFVGALAYAPDGREVATGGVDGVVTLWDSRDLRRLRSFRAQALQIHGLAFAPRGKALATSGSVDEVVRVWDPETGRALAELPGHRCGAPALAFSHDGALLAAARGDGSISLWDARTWRRVAIVKGPRAWLGAIAFAPDGRSLATGGDDRTLRIWDGSSWAKPRKAG
ncbi:WD40 repeat domain-containing protein [Singulisphaera sp. PoT]|uniref:WD40 repeat domain-containing protein n=1 Tax=Singulisphaera sp. PoT TaxID=3411797 RepID=UPI003BF536DB